MRHALGLILLLVVESANAAPLTWTLNNVTTSDGASWTGTFDYDDVSNTYSAINIVSTVGGFPNPIDTVSNDNFLSVGCTDPATANGVTLGFNADGVTIFCMDFASSLTNIGGTVNLVTGSIGWATLGIGETITGGSVSAPSAGPVKWTLNNVTTSGGASWTGTFHYDANTNTYNAINIVSTVSGFPNPIDTVSNDNFLSVGCTDPATANGVTLGFNADGVTIFCMDFASSLTNIGGTVNLVTGSIGWATLGIGETITGGSVTGAPFPAMIAPDIDVEPNDPDNYVETEGNFSDKVNVAIIGDNNFDATQVDATTLKFGVGEAVPLPLGTPGIIRDADGDGLADDLQVKFRIADTGITCEYAEAVELTGETFSGDAFSAADSVTTPDCPTSGCHP